jgi:nucleoside-diphosphate-sugar epimerase
MKVLVTGGGGFLGTTICRQLAVAGHTVAAFQRTPATHLITAGVESVEGDIRDTDAVGTAVAGCDAVIHCAAYASLWGKADLFESINVGGTTNVLDACRESGVRQVVYTSSPSVVLNGEDIEGGDESLPMVSEPLMPYQATKIVADRMVRKANAPGLRTVVLRPHHDRLFLPAPEKKSDVVFVENGARAHVQALMELNSGARCAGKAYFVTNNAPQLQGEFIQRLLTAVGINARIRKIPPALARMAGRSMEACWRLLRIKSEPLLTRFMAEQLCTSHWFDGSAARRDFGYVAPISIDQGLEIMARQFKH